MKNKIDRRRFLKQSASIGAGLTIVKSGVLKAGQSPNGKLNIAVADQYIRKTYRKGWVLNG